MVEGQGSGLQNLSVPFFARDEPFGMVNRMVGLSPAAIRGDAGVGDVDAIGRGGGLVEDVDGDSAAGVPVAGDAEPGGGEEVGEGFGDADGAVFVEGAVVAEGTEEEFEGFRFDEPIAGDVVDDEVGKVGLGSDGTERGELGAGEADAVGGPGVWIGDAFKGGFLGRGGKGRLATELIEVFVDVGHAPSSRN